MWVGIKKKSLTVLRQKLWISRICQKCSKFWGTSSLWRPGNGWFYLSLWSWWTAPSSLLSMEAREKESYCIIFPVLVSVLINLIPAEWFSYFQLPKQIIKYFIKCIFLSPSQSRWNFELAKSQFLSVITKVHCFWVQSSGIQSC